MKKNILIGITGSIAAYKIYDLIRMYKNNDFDVKVVLTKNALNFVSPLVLQTLSREQAYFEEFNPDFDTEHINLTKWADVFVLAPISANTISKCAQGISDNLLTSIFCSFLGSKKPCVMAPAMNENMLLNPFIQKNISLLKEQNIVFVEPETGFLACNAIGKGRLASVDTIFQITKRCLFEDKKNNSKKIVITSGGTKEKIDNVRYITNASSGKMGLALSDAAFEKGFEVCMISVNPIKRPYKVIEVQSAIDTLNALKKEDFDYLIMAMAVSDFRVENVSETKISKENIKDNLTLELIKNPDVVSEIAKNKKENQRIIGFCLGDCDLINCAKNKLKNKNLDYIVANEVNSSLNKDTNKVTIIDKNGKISNIEEDLKEKIAQKILEVVCD